MPITRISIENFKGVRDRIEIPLRPITLLFGANSAGKSTILQALVYLRELLERGNADADRLLACGAAVDLGGFRKFVYEHETSRTVRIGVTITVDADGLPIPGTQRVLEDSETPESNIEELRLTGVDDVTVLVSVKWDPSTKRPWITEYTVGINQTAIAKVSAEPGFQAALSFFDGEHPIFSTTDYSDDFEDGDPDVAPLSESLSRGILDLLSRQYLTEGNNGLTLGSRVIPQWGRTIVLPNVDESDSVEEKARAEMIISQILVGSGELVLRELQSLRYLGPIRTVPGRDFQPVRTPVADRWADGSSAWDLLFGADEEIDWFDPDAFRNLNLGYSLEIRKHLEIPADGAIASFLMRSRIDPEISLTELESLPIHREIDNMVERARMTLVSESSKVEVEPIDVGIGVSQVLPVIIGTLAPGCRLFVVEQPELHIHPAVQCALGDAFAKAAIANPDRLIIAETHSEHLMLRLLRRIREQNADELPPDAPPLLPEHVSVLYIASTDSGMEVTELPISPDGDFDRQWPKGFFEERGDELF